MEREAATDFRALLVWRKAHQFALAVYNYSDYFPQKEVCGLTPQLRRAAVAIPASLVKALGREQERKMPG